MGKVQATSAVKAAEPAQGMQDDIDNALAELEEEFQDLNQEIDIDEVGLMTDLDDALASLDVEEGDEDGTTEPGTEASVVTVEEVAQVQEVVPEPAEEEVEEASVGESDASPDTSDGNTVTVMVDDSAIESLTENLLAAVQPLHSATDQMVSALVSDVKKLNKEVRELKKVQEQLSEDRKAVADVQSTNTNGVINRLENLGNQMATVMDIVGQLRDGKEDKAGDPPLMRKGIQEKLTNHMKTLVDKGMKPQVAAEALSSKLNNQYTAQEILDATGFLKE